MALQFRPPEELIRQYMERPSPGQVAVQGMSNALQSYAQMKAQEQQKAMQEKILASQDASRMATQFGAVAPYVPEAQIPNVARQYGINIPGAQPVVPAPMGSPAEQIAQQSLPSEHTTGSLIDRWNAMQTAPGGGVPPNKPTSKFGREQYAKDLNIQKTERDLAVDPNAPIDVMSEDAALRAGKVHPKAKIVDTSNQNNAETRNERLAAQLRTGLTSSKPYENLNTLKASKQNIENAVTNPGAYGDLGILFDSMRTLDPGSVVMVGEQQRFQATGSLPDRVANSMNQLVSGKSLTPEQRQEILRYADGRLKTAHGIYSAHAEPTLKQAKRMGLDPMEIDPYYGQSFQNPQTSTGTAKSFIKPGEEAEYEAFKRAAMGGQ